MPRKIRPKYVIDPVQEVSKFSFTEGEIQLLFAVAPLEGDRRQIVAQLESCAREYFWLRSQNRQKPTRAEQNATLKEVGQLARDLEIRLRILDTDTEWELMKRFSAPYPTNAIADLADRLGDFAHAAGQARRAGIQNSGPRIQTHVQRAIEKLANLYEEFAGNRFSHSPRLRTDYDGTPHSPAGRFIVAFFKIVDRGIPSTSLSTAMASIVRSRRARDNGTNG
jgi:hypothetical protein